MTENGDVALRRWAIQLVTKTMCVDHDTATICRRAEELIAYVLKGTPPDIPPPPLRDRH